MTSKAFHSSYQSQWKLIPGTRLQAATAALALAYCLLAPGASAQAQTYTTLHSFDGTDGSNAQAPLIQATDGHLYGTAAGGGANGGGTVFKITPSGALTTLYDGLSTAEALVQGTDGNFYGTTGGGGADGLGTVFKITPGGTLTTLHSFYCADGRCTYGKYPYVGLIEATDWNFYGITNYGGSSTACPSPTPLVGCGTVFKITPSGTLTTLHSFDGTDGIIGIFDSPLVQATDGNFYGTTSQGGANGQGTVFKITPSGTLTTLYNFCSQSGCADGTFAQQMIQATDGDFYGVAGAGGVNGVGTIFKITPSGTLTTLYNFCSQSGCTDGSYPDGVIQASDGNFYGTSYGGGAYGAGTIFKITPSGALTTLYSFCSQSGCTDGSDPYWQPMQDTNGDLYGTTTGGGANGDGTVFSLSVGLGPFVEPQTTSGKVGALVKILGTDLTGATSVTFNGTPAVFTVESESVIKATVPEGATSGKVEVTLPGNRPPLSSNVPFRVVP